ncbi:MAG: hypothetical protein IJV31_03735 [Clostridia bacterium]|nr:hypothetical protein [Clostridia bacterium]
MDNLIKEQIKFKIKDIDKLFAEYELIFQKIKAEKPDLFDMTILGSVLHSFYNGLENIFEIIAKNIDGIVPSGNKSHQELLHQMASKNNNRNEIVDEELYLKLREYVTFRHFYRHAYSFQLDWDKMENLVDDIYMVWENVKESLEVFMKNEDEK